MRAVGAVVLRAVAALLLVSALANSSSHARPLRLPKNFYYLGTFPVSKNELDGDPAQLYAGGIEAQFEALLRKRKSKDSGGWSSTNLFSEVVEGGKVLWQKLPVVNGDTLAVRPKNVDFNKLVQTLVSVEAQEVQGWACLQFSVKRSGRYSVACEGTVTCFVDTTRDRLAGDMFRTGRMRNPLFLAAGKHRLFVHLKYKVAAQVRVEIEAVGSASLQVFAPHFVPDLVALGAGVEVPDAPASSYGLGTSSALSIPVLNEGAELLEVRFSLGKEAGGKSIELEPLSASSGFVAPGQVTSIGMLVRLSSPLEASARCPLQLQLVAESRVVTKAGEKAEEADWKRISRIPVNFRCRTTRQSFVFTFVDHDGTVSQAAAVAPLPRKSGSVGGRAGVLLSQHGTGVDLKMQADSYKHKSRGKTDADPYVFGVQGAWVLAPTRQGAHNWEYTGFLSAVTALERLGDLSALPTHLVAAAAKEGVAFPLPDANRVLFTGHSMGGHGAYVSSTHLTGRGIAAAPAAGWFRKENYGDSNSLFTMHDIGSAHAEPALKAVLEACVVEYACDLLASNLAALPAGVRLRVGSDDRAVPPWQVKRMHRLLREHGVARAEYEELPGKAHWWWDSHYSNDGGAVNDEAMRAFYARVFGEEGDAGGGGGEGRDGSAFSFTVFNPASFESQEGCRVLQQIVSLKRSRIDFMAGEGETRWRLKTSNVRRLGIDARSFCGGDDPVGGGRCVVEVDGGSRHVLDAGVLELCLGPNLEEGNEVEVDATGQQEAAAWTEEQKQWHRCALQSGLDAHIPLGSSSSYAFEQHGRGPSNAGPARAVFASPFLTVAGTAGNGEEAEKQLLRAALYIGNSHFTSAGSRTAVLPDWALSTKLSDNNNLILLGRPDQNTETAKFMAELASSSAGPPVRFLEDAIEIGPDRFGGEDIGVVFLAPHFDSSTQTARLRLVVAGLGERGTRNAMALAQPTIPPMMRAPFSNQVPDFVVVGDDVRGQGAGGILSAGFWAPADWAWDSQSSYRRDL